MQTLPLPVMAATLNKLTGKVNGTDAQKGAVVLTYETEIEYGPDGPQVTETGFAWLDPLIVPFVTVH
jgi:hypothetical protein